MASAVPDSIPPDSFLPTPPPAAPGYRRVVLRRLGVLSVAKVYGIVMAGMGVLIGLGMLLFMGGMGLAFGDPMMVGSGFFAVLIMPLMYGAIGFVAGILMAALYNLVADKVGGVELHVD